MAATANKEMDTNRDTLRGYMFTHHFMDTSRNPLHGQSADHQLPGVAKAIASKAVSSQIKDAAGKALQGDATGALKELGQAGHTAEDPIRHKFQPASEHPVAEETASPAELQAGTQATEEVLNEFVAQMYEQGLAQGLSFEEIAALVGRALQDLDANTASTGSRKARGREPK